MEHLFWIPFVIIITLITSYIIGGMFRQWNEGKRFERNDYNGQQSFLKTAFYGFIILIIIMFLFGSC